MSFGLKNFSPDTSSHSKRKVDIPEIFNLRKKEISPYIVNKNGNYCSDIKVYIRCASETDNMKQQCIKILSPEHTSLVVNKQISKDCSSMELYNAKYIFDNQQFDNFKIFDIMCQPYLEQIMKLESNGYDGSKNIFHPIFVTFGRTNSGKTHSIIGNVDEMERKSLNGILVQFVSKLFKYFESKNKKCNIKICGLEEYGECLNTLKLYDLFAKWKSNKNSNKFEEVIGSPPSKSKNSHPTFVEIENINDLERLMADGCESIHCGLFDDKIVSCGHCLFQLKINNKYYLSFFDMAGYHPNYKLNNNVIPSNLTLNQFIQMLYHHHQKQEKQQQQQQQFMYIPTQSVGLIPNLQNILIQNSDIVFLLHISDHINHIEHTLKTLEIAKMFPNHHRYQDDIGNKTLIHLDSHTLHDYDINDDVDDDDTNCSELQQDQETQCVEKNDLIFSPPPKIRMRKTHRASTILLNNVKSNIDKIPIKSRRKISSMPLEILQLKKSKNNSDKTFLVPLGFSTYDAFIVERENMNNQNCLELHLRTNRSKFYIIIDNLQKFKNWIQSQIGFDLHENIDIDTDFDELDNNDHVSFESVEELNYDYSFKLKPVLILSILLNIICFFILSSVQYIDVEISFFEPLREMMNRMSREFEIIHNRYHQHQYQYDEINSLYDELNTITSYCHDYIQSTTESKHVQEMQTSDKKPELSQNENLLEFCETFVNAHQTCPVDRISIPQIL